LVKKINEKVKNVVLIFIVLLLGWGGYRWYFVDNNSGDSGVVIKDVQQSSKAGVDKVPFEELTIPYLRNRIYQSFLGEKKTYKEYKDYNSYLTSYVSDGLKINGLLTIPKGEVPKDGWPAVVFVHGYIPPTQYKTTEKYLEYVDYLAKSGLVVFKIDLRGHGDSEGEPGGAYYSSDYVIDVLNAHSALQKSGFVDTYKIGLWGHSMAGNVVFRAAVVKKDIPSVVIWAGAVYSYADMAKYGIQDNSYRPVGMSAERQKKRQELFGLRGQFSEESVFWKQVVGLNYLDGVTTKFFVHHALDDAVVNIGYSRDFISELKKRSVRGELFEYKTGGHNISGVSFSQAIKRSAESFL
jgi:uncharacterized protein